MAANFIQSVDERTGLAGANKLEILLFSLGSESGSDREEVYGINVFKVREVLRVPTITKAPDMPRSVTGMVSLRGTMVPVIKLAEFCGSTPSKEPSIMIVTEYNKHMQGFLVHSVENILRLEWSDVKEPPAMMVSSHGGLITAVTELDDGRIVMIMDVEKVLAETAGFGTDPSVFEGIERIDVDKTVLFADDSSVARKQVEDTLKHLGLRSISAKTGAEAWSKLLDISKRAESLGVCVTDIIGAVITDVEMPEMDGYVLTKNIKKHPVLSKVPVIMHSSLSADANMALGKGVGADVYVAKFDPIDLSLKIRELLVPRSSGNGSGKK